MDADTFSCYLVALHLAEESARNIIGVLQQQIQDEELHHSSFANFARKAVAEMNGIVQEFGQLRTEQLLYFNEANQYACLALLVLH